MANFGTTQRIPTTITTPSPTADTHEPKGPQEKLYSDLKIYWPFSIPLTSEAAAIRILRNLENLGLYYALFLWIILFMILIPLHKVSLILLVIMTYLTTLYCLLLRAYPNSVLLHRSMDKRFVLALLVFATVVLLILTEAGVYLAVTLACVVPLVLLHAVLWVSHHALVETDEDDCCCAKQLTCEADRTENNV